MSIAGALQIWGMFWAAVLAGLMTRAIIVAWFISPLLPKFQPILEMWRDEYDQSAPGPWRIVAWAQWFVGYLLLCAYCLGYHVSFWLVVYLWCWDVVPSFYFPFVWLGGRAVDLCLPASEAGHYFQSTPKS
jgi:hypothetical protein